MASQFQLGNSQLHLGNSQLHDPRLTHIGSQANEQQNTMEYPMAAGNNAPQTPSFNLLSSLSGPPGCFERPPANSPWPMSQAFMSLPMPMEKSPNLDGAWPLYNQSGQGATYQDDRTFFCMPGSNPPYLVPQASASNPTTQRFNTNNSFIRSTENSRCAACGHSLGFFLTYNYQWPQESLRPDDVRPPTSASVEDPSQIGSQTHCYEHVFHAINMEHASVKPRKAVSTAAKEQAQRIRNLGGQCSPCQNGHRKVVPDLMCHTLVTNHC